MFRLENFDVANFARVGRFPTYLVEVDDGLPELVLELVEVPHTNLTEVTRVVLVDVGTVVVLTTGHTATTGRLAVLADTTFTGRDMATVLAGLGETGRHCGGFGVVVGSKVVAGQVQICVAREVVLFPLWSASLPRPNFGGPDF